MSKELLPDVPDVYKNAHITYNLEVVFCGMAAGELSAKVGGYYANKNNKFWNILSGAGFTDKIIKSCNYEEVLEYHLGLTDLVKNQSGMDKKIDATDNDIEILKNNIEKLQPKVLTFNGKKSASAFLNKNKKKISWGEQENKYSIGITKIWVLPSTSGVNTVWKKYNHEEEWNKLYQKIKNK
ncbi:mismatch-specific DNA-glycosylase [Candidatus Parcubacteria bacterium]|nr:mismatch-specific DNA-glycosylase [Candidatus Parcubacteria bacterium]